MLLRGQTGAGKSTTAPTLLQENLNVNEYVNADVIAQSLSGFTPEKVAFRAGRIMLNRLEELVSDKVNRELKGSSVY